MASCVSESAPPASPALPQLPEDRVADSHCLPTPLSSPQCPLCSWLKTPGHPPPCPMAPAQKCKLQTLAGDLDLQVFDCVIRPPLLVVPADATGESNEAKQGLQRPKGPELPPAQQEKTNKQKKLFPPGSVQSTSRTPGTITKDLALKF